MYITSGLHQICVQRLLLLLWKEGYIFWEVGDKKTSTNNYKYSIYNFHI